MKEPARQLIVATGQSKLTDKRMIMVLNNSNPAAPQVVAVTGEADPDGKDFQSSIRDALTICLLLDAFERGLMPPHYYTEIGVQTEQLVEQIKEERA